MFIQQFNFFELSTSIFLRFVWALNPFNFIEPYFINQSRAVIADITRKVVITRSTLFVAVELFKSKFRVSPTASIMSSMILNSMIAIATNARLT